MGGLESLLIAKFSSFLKLLIINPFCPKSDIYKQGFLFSLTPDKFTHQS